MDDNRRAHKRFTVALSLEIHVGERVFNAVAKNLSLGGLGLASKVAVPENTMLSVNLFLVEDGIEDGTSPTIDVPAQAVWCTPSDDGGFLAGLRFEHLGEDDRQRIQQFLRRLSGG